MWSTLGWDNFHGAGASFSFIHEHVRSPRIGDVHESLLSHVWKNDEKAMKQVKKFEKK